MHPLCYTLHSRHIRRHTSNFATLLKWYEPANIIYLPCILLDAWYGKSNKSQNKKSDMGTHWQDSRYMTMMSQTRTKVNMDWSFLDFPKSDIKACCLGSCQKALLGLIAPNDLTSISTELSEAWITSFSTLQSHGAGNQTRMNMHPIVTK